MSLEAESKRRALHQADCGENPPGLEGTHNPSIRKRLPLAVRSLAGGGQ
jgi:hypothetical protein